MTTPIKLFLGIALPFLFSAGGSTKALADILLIGDSHVQGTFGRTLDQGMRDATELKSHRIMTVAVGGAIPQWYLEGVQSPWGFFSRGFNGEITEYEHPITPNIRSLISQLQPHSTVIIELGTNFIWGNNRMELHATTDHLISILSNANARCIWIGPPPLGERHQIEIQDINLELADVITKTTCQWISSFPLTFYPDSPQADHIHYDRAGSAGVEQAKIWAQKVLQQLLMQTW